VTPRSYPPLKVLNNTKTIGISGVAGSGKDLFFNLLSKHLNDVYGVKCRKLSIAEALKKEVSEWTLEKYGIDCANCSREDKEVVRPLLVFHGTVRRGQTSGRYWIDILDKKIKNLKLDDGEILVITDIRFCQYKEDEVFWLKNELGGTLVHLSNFVRVGSADASPPVIIEKGPANDAEKSNDPNLKNLANYSVRWEFLEGTQDEINSALTDLHIKRFVKAHLKLKKPGNH